MKYKFHFNDLPEGVLIELRPDFCSRFCKAILNKEHLKSKLSFGRVIGIEDWKGARLFNSRNRFPVKLLESLRKKYFIEDIMFSIRNIEKNIISIGTHADKRIYYPRFPFMLKDLVYVYSHLIFDGSARPKGCYFMAPQNELLEYHNNRLQNFGMVQTNFMDNDKQLYFPWVIGFIVNEIFQVNSFKSMEARIPENLKGLAIKDQNIANEIIKSAIVDEGWVGDRIGFSLSNGELCKDVWEIAKAHYNVGRFPENPRIRKGITNKKLLEWAWKFSSKSIKNLHKNIEFPLSYKQKAVEFIVKRQSRGWYKRKPNETKKLIIKSLLDDPKSITDLAFELNIRATSVSNLINGVHSGDQNTDGLIDKGIITFVGFRKNKKGERTGKSKIYTIADEMQAKYFLNK
ncbi:MAG: hypothetical protein ISS36_01665 [Candidatus Aenigmarchaeota archaeon]|nr:hypothetical protein [Candidatus Aenigmarchaeota archaeon]